MIVSSKSTLFFAAVPFALSLFYVLACLLRLLSENVVGILEILPFPLFTFILTVVLLFLEKTHSSHKESRSKIAYAVPAFMCPTALCSAWTLSPSHFGGIAWGGVYYFMEEVTRYPNFGSFNTMILLGMLTMLCASLLPAMIAWGYLSVWPKLTICAFTLLAVTVYLIVAVKLDLNLWLAGIFGTKQESLIFLLYGPLTRTLAIFSILYLSFSLIYPSKS